MSEQLAKLFHETYERLAPNFGYETRKDSAVPWEDVPARNKHLMIAVAEIVEQEYFSDVPGSRPVLLDLFCGAGGCTKGYQMAGFHVIGVDIEAQPHYIGDAFVQADALEYLAAHGHEYSAISASPPCQGYSKTRNLQGNDHPMLIEETRRLLIASGKPYVVENVPGAPLRNPVLLVGSMFGLLTMRPRLFECNFPVPFRLMPQPNARHAKMGRPPRDGEFVHVVGHMSDVAYCRAAMGISWMTQHELAQAIPPAYTKFIGDALMAFLRGLFAEHEPIDPVGEL